MLGGFFTLLTGNSPITALQVMISSGFGCMHARQCALLTTIQFTIPLILLGLSAAVAFRANFFSIGQSGQMILGAAAANWTANNLFIDSPIHPLVSLFVASAAGLLFALIPAGLKIFLNINEIIITILLNSVALYIVGIIPTGYGRRIPESARLSPLVESTKLSTGLFFALGITLILVVFLWRSSVGYEIRMSGHNISFARSGGINPGLSVFIAMMISGALAGIAGGIEVLGVHYRMVQNFTGSDLFDGVMVALMGFSHPLGILVSSFLLGGIRLATMTGLTIQLGIPRSIGGMVIATMVIVMGSDRIYHYIKTQFRSMMMITRNQ